MARLLTLTACLLALPSGALGQTVDVQGQTSVTYWPQSTRYYQHTMHARTDAVVRWRRFVARLKLGVKRWGNSDAKLEGAMLNAETARVYSRRQGVALGYRFGRDGDRLLEVGAEVDRRSVHHVWRNNGKGTPAEVRHNHFPGDWRVGRAACKGEAAPDWGRSACPSLGYWGGVRPYLRAQVGALRAHVRGPLLAWKTLTLPWPALRAQVSYVRAGWRVKADIQGLARRAWTGTAGVMRRVTGPLWARLTGGWAHAPQWRDQRLFRVAFGFRIDT